MKNWRHYQNYMIIAIVSIIAVFFLPMLGSSVGIGLVIPTTAAGWIVYILTKLCIVVINILTLDQFIKQAKVNIKDNPRYLEAAAYFNLNPIEDEAELLTPSRYLNRIYRKRMSKLAITSILGVFGLTQAILAFDWVSMLTYLFTVIAGLIYGWATMNDVEDYWTNDYYKLMEKDRYEKQNAKSVAVVTEESNQPLNDNIHDNRGANILESSNNCINSCTVQSMVLDYCISNNPILVGPANTSDAAPICSHPSTEESARQNKSEEK